MLRSAYPPSVRVPTYAISVEMSHGSRYSYAMFHCWMIPRSTWFGFGERMNTPGGSTTWPELISGTGTRGIPLASVVTEANCSADALKLMSCGNEPRIGRDHGSGLIVRP